MKFAILNIAIMVMALASYVTAGAKNSYRATYNFRYTKDSINSLKGNDVLYLEFDSIVSHCYSYLTFQNDSLRATPEGRKICRELFRAAISREGAEAVDFPHKRSTFIIDKFGYSNIIKVKDLIDSDVFEYEVQKCDFDWQICDSVKNINGYECYKAKCDFHGRNWIVWFTPDIPISDGPWVFCGLPGLIIEAHDSNQLYSFEFIGLSSILNIAEDWVGRGKKIGRIRFLSDKYRFLKNQNSLLDAELGTSSSSTNDTRYLFGLEPDFLYKRD